MKRKSFSATPFLPLKKRRLLNWLLFGFLLLIPTQLGRHFWFEWSYVKGMRVDYLSPVLYLTHIFWIGIFLSKLQITNYKLQTNNKLQITKLLVIVFVLINIIFANCWQMAIYRWIRVGQLIWTITYFRKEKELFRKYLKMVVPVWIVGESVLAIMQIINNGSIQGIMYWLGERRFSGNTIGIAQINWWGQQIVRAYGTFSHPNSLAGFLLVGLLIKKITNYKLQITKWEMFVWLMGIVGIILTGSRTVWALLIFYFQFSIFKKLSKNKIINLSMTIIVVLLEILIARKLFIVSGWDSMGIEKRMELYKASGEMIVKSPVIGVGLGNFVKNMGNHGWIQPVHNIFVLWLVETGMVGTILLVFGLIKNKLRITKYWEIWIVILITGMVDHYWLTLIQNWWMLGILFALNPSVDKLTSPFEEREKK